MHNPAVQMRRSRLAVAVLVLALASSATALAGRGYHRHGYKITDASWHRPPSGSLYSVNVHGVAAQKSLVYLYLDNQPCRPTWLKESSLNVSPFTAGESSFRDTGKALVTLSVTGHFNTSFTAKAGTTAQPEYACSYLTTPNSQGQYQVTAAHDSNAYFVTG